MGRWIESTCGIRRVMRLIGNTERYFEALKDAKVRGYLFEQQNYIEGQSQES